MSRSMLVAAAALAFATVALTAGLGDGSGDEAATSPERPRVTARVDEESGHAVFARMGCGSCHTLAAAGSAGSIGPHHQTDRPATLAVVPGAAPTDHKPPAPGSRSALRA